jgi:putative drug exporter of the RND superfamily
VHLTGFDALVNEGGGNGDPGVLLEALIGGFGALLVLAFVFASLLALVPLVMAFISIMTTFLLLLGLTQVTAVSPIVQYLIALIGLGVAIDYSLLIVSRWREERSQGGWANAVSRRRWLAAGAGIAVILALSLAASDLRLGTSDADTLAKSGDAKQGLVALERAGIGEGALLPHELLVAGASDPARVAAALHKVEGIHGATAPAGSDWRRGGAALVEAIPIHDSGSDRGNATLERVRDVGHQAGPDVRVGGQPAANADFIDAVYGSFPLMVALIAITTFVLLAR